MSTNISLNNLQFCFYCQLYILKNYTRITYFFIAVDIFIFYIYKTINIKYFHFIVKTCKNHKKICFFDY